MTPSELAARLGPVLRDVAYPAAKWQLVAAALGYGADIVSMTELHRLPERHYRNLGDVVLAIYEVLISVAPTTQYQQRRDNGDGRCIRVGRSG